VLYSTNLLVWNSINCRLIFYLSTIGWLVCSTELCQQSSTDHSGIPVGEIRDARGCFSLSIQVVCPGHPLV